MTIQINNINPMIEVTLEKGKTSLFRYKFKKDKIKAINDTRCQVQPVKTSID